MQAESTALADADPVPYEIKFPLKVFRWIH